MTEVEAEKMLKRTMTVAALAAVLGAPAFAQTPSTVDKPSAMDKLMTTHAKSAGFMHNQTANEWRSSKLIGASIYGPDNNSIGDVNDVLVGDNGRIRAVVVGVGGFLGVGEKNVALPFTALNIQRDRSSGGIQKVTVSYSKDQLKNAPAFAYYKAGQPQTTGQSSDTMPTMNKNK
jgi:sporulation protein YlmC with PRC-barrel domain